MHPVTLISAKISIFVLLCKKPNHPATLNRKKNKIRKYQSKTTFFYLCPKYLFDIQSVVFFEGHILRGAKRI
ncbi:MAG TPA: hypothetical protein DCO83_18310, partial [Mucilaginibacter sp.]|nr:hypothetical protein [Mucilaginibacter sp.]